MTEKERREKILENKSDMRSMLEKASDEKRDLTKDEQAIFDGLENEVRMHMNYFKANEPVNNVERRELNIRSIFAKNLSEAIESGNKSTKIDIRTNIPIDTADIGDTIPVLQKDILEVLEPMLILNKVGVKMQTNVQGVPMWPTVGNVEAEILGENAELSDKSIDFGKIAAAPKRSGVTIRVSRRAINQTNLGLYDIVVNSIAEAIARLINKWLVNTTPIATGCEGVFVKPENEIIPLSLKPSLSEIVALETAVLNSNVNGEKGQYVFGTAMNGKLKTSPIEKGNPKMILEGSELNGYHAQKTNLMPSDCIGFGFFEYAVLSQFGAFSLIVDPYTLATKNEIRFTGNTDYDITVLRKEAFSLGRVVSVPTIYAKPSTVELATKVNTPITEEVVVSGVNLTANISATVGGTNASMVKVNSATISKDENGRVDVILTITYTPTAAAEHTAKVTLKSSGAADVVIDVNGTATA